MYNILYRDIILSPKYKKHRNRIVERDYEEINNYIMSYYKKNNININIDIKVFIKKYKIKTIILF